MNNRMIRDFVYNRYLLVKFLSGNYGIKVKKRWQTFTDRVILSERYKSLEEAKVQQAKYIAEEKAYHESMEVADSTVIWEQSESDYQ